MSDVRKLPAVAERVETGTVQFGDDWPGVFLRGDYAGPMAFYLELMFERLEKLDRAEQMKIIGDPMIKLNLKGLVRVLQNSDVRNHKETTPSQTALKVEAAFQEAALKVKHDRDCDANDGSICFCGYSQQQEEKAAKQAKEQDPSAW
jgi:hypothetical protein